VHDRAELPLDPDAPEEAGVRRPLHFRWDALLLVLTGGFVGTMARYGLSVAAPTRSGHWPWATFIANMAGAFILGALLEWLARGGPDADWRPRARLFAGTGFCGGFTTYSTMAVEADLLVRDRDAGLAVGYLAASVVLGFVATLLGIAVAVGRHRLRRHGDDR
jgi:CrcB protein